MGERGIGFATDHPGNFLHPCLAFHFDKAGNRPALFQILAHHKMAVSVRRNLGKMTDGDDLPFLVTAVEKAGGTITKPIFDFPGGQRFQFRDRDGYELAVWSKPA